MQLWILTGCYDRKETTGPKTCFTPKGLSISHELDCDWSILIEHILCIHDYGLPNKSMWIVKDFVQPSHFIQQPIDGFGSEQFTPVFFDVAGHTSRELPAPPPATTVPLGVFCQTMLELRLKTTTAVCARSKAM